MACDVNPDAGGKYSLIFCAASPHPSPAMMLFSATCNGPYYRSLAASASHPGPTLRYPTGNNWSWTLETHLPNSWNPFCHSPHGMEPMKCASGDLVAFSGPHVIGCASGACPTPTTPPPHRHHMVTCHHQQPLWGPLHGKNRACRGSGVGCHYFPVHEPTVCGTQRL